MPTKNLGRIRMNPRGEYDSTQSYDKLDIVSINGETWMAKTSVPSGNSPVGVVENTYWQQVFSRPTGASGSFTTSDGKTVTVEDGVITSIA